MSIISTNGLLRVDEDDSSIVLEKNQQYYRYIVNHIRNVQIAAQNLLVPILDTYDLERYKTLNCNNLRNTIHQAIENIAVHDSSKFGDEEFDAYRIRFYPTPNEEAKYKEDPRAFNEVFEEAWKHHYTNNPHHAKYWYDFEIGCPRCDMSMEAILEMFCDWEAMSMNFGGSTIDWWKDNREDESKWMSSDTLEIVDLWINELLPVTEYEKKEERKKLS